MNLRKTLISSAAALGLVTGSFAVATPAMAQDGDDTGALLAVAAVAVLLIATILIVDGEDDPDPITPPPAPPASM